jgi:hypothetical protein
MANVAIGNPYVRVLNAIVVSIFRYNMKLGYWLEVALALATQRTGFGLAGPCRRFLVWPASMVWPQNLVACALLNMVHVEDDGEDNDNDNDNDGQVAIGLERMEWKGAFLFFFLPGETSFSAFLET